MSWSQWRELLSDTPLPAAIVDLDAFDANLALLADALPERATIRVASKSVRVPDLLRRALAHERVRGVMTFSAAETAWLASQGIDDLLLAYPVARAHDARLLAETTAGGAAVLITVDCADHVRLLERAARAAEVRLTLCLDIDLSLRWLGGHAHLGVRRSPLRSAAEATALARQIAASEWLELGAVLGYEAQVAAMADRLPSGRRIDPIRRLIKSRSVPLAARRRADVVAALEAEGHRIEVVNGGGTGSVHSTGADDSVTEITVGSGLFCPHLFDGYDALPLQPAAFFALPVARRSDPGFVTCGSGGFVASGSPGPDRQPMVHLPAGLAPSALEGFGEVQTPLTGPGADSLSLGDPVICRHAKAGELMERFGEVLLLADGRIEQRARTYRGHGQTFF